MTSALVIGAGIVGAACAESLQRAGFDVSVFDSGSTGGGATAAGMGHVLLLDDTEPQFALTRRSQQLWDQRADEWPASVERAPCGTLWLAEDAEELDEAARKAAFLTGRNVSARVLQSGRDVRAVEPSVAGDLAGGLLLEEDSVIYAPTATDWLLRGVGSVERGTRVRRVSGDADRAVVELADGRTETADLVVVSAGHHSVDLLDPVLTEGLPALRVFPKKGHLAITDRIPGFLQRQVVELGYVKSAHANVAEAVACNIQPRPTGQLLVGSSRQLDNASPELEPHMIARVLRRAQRFLPGLADVPILRTWVGFRPASPDHLPWIGSLPASRRVMLATGHEGWGMTAALATGELVAELAVGRDTTIPAQAFDPARANQPAPLH